MAKKNIIYKALRERLDDLPAEGASIESLRIIIIWLPLKVIASSHHRSSNSSKDQTRKGSPELLVRNFKDVVGVSFLGGNIVNEESKI